MENREIIETLEKIENSSSTLYSFLYDLYYEEKCKDLKFIEDIYARYLDDKREAIKAICIYGLLFFLKLQNDKYKEIALKYISNSWFLDKFCGI